MRLKFKLLTVSGALSIFFDTEDRCIRFDSEGKSIALSGCSFDLLISRAPELLAGTDIDQVKLFLEDISKGNYLCGIDDELSPFTDATAVTHITPIQATLLLRLIRETIGKEENEIK